MEVKKCYKCNKEKHVKEFSKNKSRSDGLNNQCKSCHKVARRDHYIKNKELIKKQVKNKKYELKLWYKELKSTLSCNKCQENRHWVLDFHHADPDQKDMEVSKLLEFGSKKRILKEIDKCEVLCANCHRDLHYQEQSSESL